MNRTGWVAAAGLAAVAASLGMSIYVDAGPIHALTCLWEARDGWTIEFDGEARTLPEMRDHVREQTTCVRVERAGWVNWDLVPDGHLVDPPTCCRQWVSGSGGGGEVSFWVEGTAAQATDPCRPPAPQTLPPPGCAGGPIPDG